MVKGERYWGFDPDQGYFEFSKPNSVHKVEISQANWEIFQELRGEYLFAKVIFGRVQLQNFISLIEGKAPTTEVLSFIDPGNNADLFSLGYFLNQDVLRYSGVTRKDGTVLSRETLYELIRNCADKRLALFEFLGLPNPYFWKPDNLVVIQPALAELTLQLDVVIQYIEAVIQVYEAIESTFDLEEATKFMRLELAFYKDALKNGKWFSGRPLNDQRKTGVAEDIALLESILHRLNV